MVASYTNLKHKYILMRARIQGSGEIVMADIWSLIGVILGIIFVILRVSSVQVDEKRQNSGRLIRDYDQDDDLLDDLEELILIEEFEEELEDENDYSWVYICEWLLYVNAHQRAW